jgi:hypothetical protein
MTDDLAERRRRRDVALPDIERPTGGVRLNVEFIFADEATAQEFADDLEHTDLLDRIAEAYGGAVEGDPETEVADFRAVRRALVERLRKEGVLAD